MRVRFTLLFLALLMPLVLILSGNGAMASAPSVIFHSQAIANGRPQAYRSVMVTDNMQEGDSSDDDYWDDRFFLSVVNGTVYAAAMVGTDLYIGGDFVYAGGVKVDHLAKWNGSVWSEVGGGVNGEINTIAAIGKNIYVGGSFTRAGTVAVNNIAMWDGREWTSVGNGVDGTVHAIAIDNNMVWVGGGFIKTIDEKITVNHIARWDGRKWYAVGSGANNIVYCIAPSAGYVYVGGSFTTVNNLDCRNIAFIKAPNSWNPLGAGVGGRNYTTVYSIAIDGNYVYAGGSFTTAGGISANNIARFDVGKKNWEPLTTGANGTVYSMALAAANDLYIGGSFSQAGSIPANNIGRWSGNKWQTPSMLSRGLSNNNYFSEARILVKNGTSIAIGGFFDTAGDVHASNIVLWDAGASIWSSIGKEGLGISFYGSDWLYVSAVKATATDIVLGGMFDYVGYQSCENIASWRGDHWEAYDNSNREVIALGTSYDNIYFVRDLEGPDILYKWNGESWSEVNGDYIYYAIQSIAADGPLIYIGGGFSSIGKRTFSNVAMWDESKNTWYNLADGLDGFVNVLALHNNELWAAGNFSHSGSIPIKRLAIWNGRNWRAFPQEITSITDISSVAFLKNQVYIGGIRQRGLDSVGCVAGWDGAKWTTWDTHVGLNRNGLKNPKRINALSVINNSVYAAGDFDSLDGRPAKNIAKLYKGQWTALGSGTDGPIADMAALGLSLYIGGDFHTAGGKPASCFTRWQAGPEISGATFLASGKGLAGITISFSGLGSTTTDSTGYFNFEVPYNWSGEIMPISDTYVFSPSLRTTTPLTANQPDVYFTGGMLPGKPANLTASARSLNCIDLRWQDKSTDENGFRIYRKTPGALSWQKIDSVAGNQEHYTDCSLKPGAVYLYQIFSYNAWGGAPSNIDTAQTASGIAGDVVPDSVIDLRDLNKILDIILEKQKARYIDSLTADCGSSPPDKKVNVIDLVFVVDKILHHSLRQMIMVDNDASIGLLQIEPASPYESDHVLLPVTLYLSSEVRSLQFILKYQAEKVEVGEPLLQYNEATLSTLREKEKVALVVYRADGKMIPAGDRVLLHLPVRFKTDKVEESIGQMDNCTVLTAAAELATLKTVEPTDGLIANLPDRFQLYQNYPNPFNANTEIVYTVAYDSPVRLEIVNLQGQIVTVLVDGRQSCGVKRVVWPSVHYRDDQAPTGIYFCLFYVNGECIASRKLLLIK